MLYFLLLFIQSSMKEMCDKFDVLGHFRGYMAPEYAMRGYLTDKADVYSFGIVLLETVSGKSNTNYRPKEEFVYLLDWVNFFHTVC